MRIFVFIIVILYNSSNAWSSGVVSGDRPPKLILAGGIGSRYGGVIGIQAGIVKGRYKLNGAGGILGVTGGAEMKIMPHQSIDITVGFMAFAGLLKAVHYNLYLSNEMFKGLCLSVGYEHWSGFTVSEGYIIGNVGYHFEL